MAKERIHAEIQFLLLEPEKCFKAQANRELRNERKKLCRKILSGTDADGVCFTPAYRTGYIYQWWG